MTAAPGVTSVHERTAEDRGAELRNTGGEDPLLSAPLPPTPMTDTLPVTAASDDAARIEDWFEEGGAFRG